MQHSPTRGKLPTENFKLPQVYSEYVPRERARHFTRIENGRLVRQV